MFFRGHYRGLAARLGYLGTAYAALRKFGPLAGKSVIILEHEIARLEDINQAISGLGSRHGGFSNYVIVP